MKTKRNPISEREKKALPFHGKIISFGGRLAFSFVILAFLITALPVQAQQPVQQTCDSACKAAYNAEGVCLKAEQLTGGLTPLSALCPTSQSCWCKVNPSAVCNDRCTREFGYQSGTCSPSAVCAPAPNIQTPSYGYVQSNFQVPRSQVSCGLDPTIGCCCRNLNPNVQQQVQNFQAAIALVSEKECNYQAAEGVYSVRLAGVWGGGAALRIDIPGAVPVFGQFPGSVPTAPGYPPAGLFGTGLFFQTFKIPQRLVESKPDRIIEARVTVLPTPGQSLNNFYRQSFAPNYPTDFGNQFVGQNFFTEPIACEGPPLPTPLERLPPAEGPAEIKLLRAECGPKATTYQNEYNLIDFNRESWFQFSASPQSTQQAGISTVNQFTLGGTGAPGSTPPGHVRPPGESVDVTVTTPAAQAGGKPTQGSCTFTFSGAKEFYGAEITTWDVTDNITLKEVQAGPTKFPIGEKISADTTFITFSDYNISTPLRSANVRFTFEYTGAPALAELNPLPDVALVSLNISPARATRGSEVTLTGTVARREFTASSGRLVYCTYTWEGGCYPCVGRDCKPDPNRFLGKPNWAVLVPLPWVGSSLDTIKDLAHNVTGFQFTPPVSELSIDISIPAPGGTAPPSTPATPQEIDQKKKLAQDTIDKENKLIKARDDAQKDLNSASGQISSLDSGITSLSNRITDLNNQIGGTLGPAQTAARIVLTDKQAAFNAQASKPVNDPARQEAFRQLQDALNAFNAADKALRDATVQRDNLASQKNILESRKTIVEQNAAKARNALQSNSEEKLLQFQTERAKAAQDITKLGTTSVSSYRIRASATNLITLSILTLVNTVANEENLKWYGVAGLELATLGALPIVAISEIASVIGLGSFISPDFNPEFPGCLVGGLLGCAIGDAIRNNRCTGSTLDTSDINNPRILKTCKVYFGFFTWWDIDSREEPDPDGDGDYSLQTSSCQEPTAIAKYLFNAGWWSLVQQLGDAVEGLQNKALAAEKAAAKAEYEKAGTCSACVNGIVKAQQFNTDQRTRMIAACENYWRAATSNQSRPCISTDGSIANIPFNDTCPSNTATADSLAQCRSAIEGSATRAPGKWCAKKITIEGKPFFTTEKSVFAGNTAQEVGVCVPLEEECPSADYEPKATTDAECKLLISPTDVAGNATAAEFKKITTCSACTTKTLQSDGVSRKGQWCLKVLTKNEGGKDLIDFARIERTCAQGCPAGFDPFPPPPKAIPPPPNNYQITTEGQCAYDQRLIELEKRVVNRQATGALDELDNQFIQAAQALAEGAGRTYTCNDCRNDGGVWCIKKSFEKPADASFVCTKFPDRDCLPDERARAPPQTCSAVQTALQNVNAGLGVNPEAAIQQLRNIKAQVERTLGNSIYQKTFSLNSKVKEELTAIGLAADAKALEIENKLAEIKAGGGLNGQLQDDIQKLLIRYNTVLASLVSAQATDSGIGNFLTLCAQADWKSNDACWRKTPFDLKAVPQGASCESGYTRTDFRTDIDSVDARRKKCEDFVKANFPVSGAPPTGGGTTGSLLLNPQTKSCQQGQACSQTITVTGATGSLTCSGIVTGMSCSCTGTGCTLSGTPPITGAKGDFTYTIRDAASKQATFTLTITAATTASLYTLVKLAPENQCGTGFTPTGTFRTDLPSKDFMQLCVRSDMAGKLGTSLGFPVALAGDCGPSGLAPHGGNLEDDDDKVMQLCVTQQLRGKVFFAYHTENLVQGEQYFDPRVNAVIAAPSAETITWACKSGTTRVGEIFKVETSFGGEGLDAIGTPCKQETCRDFTAPGTWFDVRNTDWAQLCASNEQVVTGAATAELPAGFEVPETPQTSESFGSVPATAQVIAEQGYVPLGSATGKATESFGPIPATGQQVIGSQVNGLAMFQQMLSQSGGRLQQLSSSIQILQSLKDGQAIYSRGFIIQPGLTPTCPATDPIFRGKAKLSRQFAAPKKDNDIVVSEAYPYWTTEGAIAPLNGTVFITIRNSSGGIVTNACRNATGGIVDCNRVPVTADYQGRTGVFRYIFVPPYDDSFSIRATALGSAGTTAGGTIIAGPKPPLGVQVTSPFLCGKPGDEKQFAVTLTEPESPVAVVNYQLSLAPANTNTGFLIYDQNGQQTLAPTLQLPISTGTSSQIVVVSKNTADTNIVLRIANSTFGELREVNLSHKISFREQPRLVLKNPGSAQSSLSEVEYTLELNNNVPRGCDPNIWALSKEPPAPTGWTVFFNATEDDTALLSAPGGNGTRFPLHAIPLTLPSIGRYPIYVHASEFTPEKFKDTGDAVAVAADAQNVYYVTTTGLLRTADKLTGSTIERTAGQNPTAVAIDDTRIYFAAGGRIASTQKTGSFSPQDIAIGSSPQQIAVDASDVYWIETGAIKRTTKLPTGADCSGSKCAIINGVPALDIALDANYVYWTERDSVKRALKANPTLIDTVVSGKANLRGLAQHGGDLYATYESAGTGKVVRIANNGTPEDVLGDVNTEIRDYVYAIARTNPIDLAVSTDGKDLYWVEGRAIYKMPADTLTGITIVYYQFSPFAPSVIINPERALASKGDLARFAVNITNRADIPVFFVLNLSPAPPPGWTSTLSRDSVQVSRSGSASAVVEVQSPPGVAPNASYAFCVRATNGTGLVGISGQGCSSYYISPHEKPGVTLTILQETPLPAGPGASVGWTAAVRNNDPPEFLSAAPINVSFELPAGWKGFILTSDNRQVQSTFLNLRSNSVNDSLKFFATSSRSAPDGDYTVKVKAAIEGLIGEGAATYSVKGCGNFICEPDRGETQRNSDGTPGPLWCEADCSQGYNNFRCLNFKNSSTLDWFECDNTRDNDVQFRTEISVPNAAQLSNNIAVVCKRGSTAEACRSAATAGNCGLSVTGFSAAAADCIAPLQLLGAGAAGQRYEGTMQCPVDHEGEYYLLFSGTQTTLGPDLSPQSSQSDTISSNFTLSCPAYRLQDLADRQAQWQTILEGCPNRVQQLQGIGQRTCADVVRQTCILRQNLIDRINGVLQTPNATQSEALLASILSTEDFIASRLQVTCFGIPGLQISGVTPPSTQVGESTLIKVKINNSFTEDYRGYASCEVVLPGGIKRQMNGFCTVFKNLTSTEGQIPVTLTDAGPWKINSCSIYADLLGSISQEQCYNAPLFTSSITDISFQVQPAEAFLTRPFDGEAVSGAAGVTAAISGYFEGYNFSYSLISPTCTGGPLIPLETPDTGFTRNYAGVWDTAPLPDKQHFACLMLTVSGAPFAVDTATAIVDNYNFVVSESTTTRNVQSRTKSVFTISMTNTGRDDDFVISCEAPPGWSTKIRGAGQEVSCGQLLSTTLGTGLGIPITVETDVPDQQTGSAQLKVIASNSQGENLETKHTLVIGGSANSPPTITNAEVTPTTVASGGSVTFKATLSDPNGDSVTSARVCADENCTASRCTMTFGTGQWSCTAQITGDSGTRNWWVEAKDSLGLTGILATGKPFTISGTGPPLKCESPNSCLSSCQPDAALCINRTDFGRRDCPLGRVCCRTEQIPACTPAAGCQVKIDAAKCVWDPVQKNYSVSAQVSWSGGSYVRVSVADLTSDRIFERTATHAVKTTTPGTHVVAASVSAANDDVLCTNITQTTCVPPGSEPPSSGVTAPKLAAVNALASSFQPGKIAANAIDGDQFSPWQSREGMPQWLRIDLGSPKAVSGVGIYTVSNRPQEFQIDTSTNCVNYRNVAAVRSATYKNDWNVTRFAQRDAKCILLNFTRSEANTVSIFEVEVYGGSVVTAAAAAPAGEFPLLPAAITSIIVIAGGAVAFIFRNRIRLWWNYVTSK